MSNRSVLRSSLAVLLTLSLVAACASPAPSWHGTPYDPVREAPDFSLLGMDGGEVQLVDFSGGPLLLYFGYTSCPDFCPTTLADLSWVFSELGDSAGEARVLFVTVDLERDTDERLASYLGKFNPEFIGARPQDPASLQALLGAYAAYAQQDPPSTHSHADPAEPTLTFTHSARVFLIDGAGQLITNYAFATPREEILADVQRALKGDG